MTESQAAPAALPAITPYEGSCSGDHGVDGGRVIRDVLTRVGDKWSLLVVATLREQRLRFTELQRHIPGISQRMLTRTLRQLERDGLVIRTAHAEVPPRVEYELSELGQTLMCHAVALANWAIENRSEIELSRERYDATHE